MDTRSSSSKEDTNETGVQVRDWRFSELQTTDLASLWGKWTCASPSECCCSSFLFFLLLTAIRFTPSCKTHKNGLLCY